MRELVDEAAKEGVVRFSAGALIHDGCHVLLLRRKPDDFLGGLWELPSGQVEDGESIEDAAVREVLEETGLTVTSITGYLGSFDFIASDGSLTREFTFTVAVNPAEVVLTEHDAYQWARPHKLPEMSEAVRGIVERWAATAPAKKRPAAVAAAHLILRRDGRVLLGRRCNTGWNDGRYQVPSGHVEHESASAAVVREAKEEAAITVEEVRCVHTMHRWTGLYRVDFFFEATRWSGQIANAEPDKCEGWQWFPLDSLPDDTVPYLAYALSRITKGEIYSEYGWETA